MNGLELSRALRSGRRVYGTLVTSPSPLVPEFLPGAGLDFVFIDTEHVPIGDDTLSWMCRAYRAMSLAPLVRIPEPDPYRACKVLDGGASGIIAPYVETVDEVRALRGAVKLRPLKGKKLAAVLEGEAELGSRSAAYLKARNEDRVLLFNVESVPALEELERLLDVPDIDAVLIGPHDLSVSLDRPEEYDRPELDAAVRGVIEVARRRGVGVGIHFWESVEREIDWARAGANLILHSSDVLLFATGLRRDLERMRSALGERSERASDGPAI